MVRVPRPGVVPTAVLRRRKLHATAQPPSVRGAYVAGPLPAGSVRRGPLQRGDQGISKHERPHAEVAIKRLFEAPGVDMVSYYDDQSESYVLRSRTGMVRWERWVTPTGDSRYVIVQKTGRDIVPSMDGTILRTLAEETAAAGGIGKPVPRDANAYPDLYERLTQLWDSPRAPEFVYIPTTGGDPNHPGGGSHGIPDLVQSRAPLVIAGPGIAGGAVSDALVRHTDVAPTVAQLLGVRPIVGRNAAGALQEQLLKWQDGAPLGDALRGAGRGVQLTGTAERAVVFAIDGLSQTVLHDELAAGNLPNLARIVARGTTFSNGSIAEYPTVTWTNHNTLVTGASPGHSGIVNNSWFDRATQTEQLITDGGAKNTLRTGRLLTPDVETLYEAVERSFPNALTVAINQPSGRGADMSILDVNGVTNLLGKLPKVITSLLEGVLRGDQSTPDMRLVGPKTAIKDTLAGAMGTAYWDSANPPKLGVFEFTQVDTLGHEIGPQSAQARAALRNVDRQIGHVLDALDRRGLTSSTAVVLTADHGMEHQTMDSSQAGGWFEALKRAKADGVATKESTRFVYVHTVRVSVEGERPRQGVAGPLRLHVVNDDQDAKGNRPTIAGAKVTVTDAAGHTWHGVTTADGRVEIALGAAKGPLKIVVDAPEFSRETLELPLA